MEWTSSLFSMYAYNIISLRSTLCLFSLHPFFSLHVFIHLGWLFCLHVLCGMSVCLFFCFGFFGMCIWFLVFFCLFFFFYILVTCYLDLLYFSPEPPFFSPSFSCFFCVPCSLSIYFSYIFALKRPPKVALPWYSLPGLPWNETIFSLCSEVCGSNTLPFAHLMGWEPLYP